MIVLVFQETLTLSVLGEWREKRCFEQAFLTVFLLLLVTLAVLPDSILAARDCWHPLEGEEEFCVEITWSRSTFSSCRISATQSCCCHPFSSFQKICIWMHFLKARGRQHIALSTTVCKILCEWYSGRLWNVLDLKVGDVFFLWPPLFPPPSFMWYTDYKGSKNTLPTVFPHFK